MGSNDAMFDEVSRCRQEITRLTRERDALLAALKTCVCAMQDYQAGIGITEMFDAGERMGRAAIKAVEGEGA